MGGVEIDQSEAILPPDGAELELVALMGVITVRVPSDVDAVFSGDSITWTITEEEVSVPSRSAVRRHLRIRSRAFLGTVHLRRVSPRSEAVQST